MRATPCTAVSSSACAPRTLARPEFFRRLPPFEACGGGGKGGDVTGAELTGTELTGAGLTGIVSSLRTSAPLPPAAPPAW